MTCREFTDHLPAWLDATLSRRPQDAVRRHAGRCRACEAYAAQYKATVGALREFAERSVDEPDVELDVASLLALARSRLRT